MEVPNGPSPRRNHCESEIEQIEHFEIESSRIVHHDDRHFHSTSAFEILNEVIRIMRYNLTGFMCISALLLCPLSAIFLSNVLVNRSLVVKLNMTLLLVAQSCGLPLESFIKQMCYKFSEMTILSLMCFPLSITLLLLAKSAVIHSVDCTYARKIFDRSRFYDFYAETWRRLVWTYLWASVGLVGSTITFLVFIVIVSGLLSEMGLSNWIMFPMILFGLVFCVVFANVILICNVAIVISVLEDCSGFEALVRSRVLIKSHTQLGISLILASTVCLAFVEGLFDHRVKMVSYGDGSSRLWEGPLLVTMYAFVLLITEMTNTVFYFSCKTYSGEGFDEECQPALADESQL